MQNCLRLSGVLSFVIFISHQVDRLGSLPSRKIYPLGINPISNFGFFFLIS